MKTRCRNRTGNIKSPVVAIMMFAGTFLLCMTASQAEDDTASVFDNVSSYSVNDRIVGIAGTNNSLHIFNSASVTNAEGSIGLTPSASNNDVLIDGSNTQWINQDSLTLGERGWENALTISNSAFVSSLDGYVGKYASASNNILRINGSESTWTNRYGIYCGLNGSGNELHIENGGTLHNNDGNIGENIDASGNRVVVTNIGSSWVNSGLLSVGFKSSYNNLGIFDGAQVTSRFGWVGGAQGAVSNSVTVDGVGASWAITSNLIVGVDGNHNAMTISGGGQVSCADAVVGDFDNAHSNTVSLTGVGSSLLLSGRLILGLEGNANSINISSGSILSIAGDCIIGEMGTSNALAVIGGALTCNSLQVNAGNRLLLSSNATVTLSGDLSNPSATPTISILNSDIFFTANANHALLTGSSDLSASLSGLVSNNALGTLSVAGTVTVSSVVYVWNLAGDGLLDLQNGARFYYLSDVPWSGSVQTSGDAVFEQISFKIANVVTPSPDQISLSWPSAPGLRVDVEWTDNLLLGVFSNAASVTGTGVLSSWTDMGDTNRLAPDQNSIRFYRIKAIQ